MKLNWRSSVLWNHTSRNGLNQMGALINGKYKFCAFVLSFHHWKKKLIVQHYAVCENEQVSGKASHERKVQESDINMFFLLRYQTQIVAGTDKLLIS